MVGSFGKKRLAFTVNRIVAACGSICTVSSAVQYISSGSPVIFREFTQRSHNK
jgi:hypothetical protein